MSYEIVKGISIKGNKVYITSADSSVRPLRFHRWECETITKILSEDGREAALARIGKNVWEGDFHLNRGSKLCNLFIEARNALPRDLSWHNYYGKTAGIFLAKMVMKLEKDPAADLSNEIRQMLDKMNDRQYILNAAYVDGYNFLNYADVSLQRDRVFAHDVLRAGRGCAWFDYPVMFKADKEFALEALKLNGCFYRNLDKTVRMERNIIFEAFLESPDKKLHEHLPDLIPLEAYCKFPPEHEFSVDTGFICDLLDVCPSLHIHRINWILEYKDVALKWCEVGKFFPFDVKYLPKDFLDTKEFQDVLISRFEGTDKYDVLINKLNEKGVSLYKGSFNSLLADATKRSEVICVNGRGKEKEDIDLM